MADIKAFRATNNLYQKDLSKYLGVTIGFISAVERGSAKLPQEQLTKLLENPHGWDTTYLMEPEQNCKHIHYDHRDMHVGQNMEGEFNAPITHYNGFSEEELERRIAERTASLKEENIRLVTENQMLRESVAYLKTTNAQLIGMLGKPSPAAENEIVDNNQ